jgi:hypothetical protein
MLSEEAIKEFQQIYKSKSGIEIPHQKAAEKAYNLIRLYKAVLKPKNDEESPDLATHKTSKSSSNI